MKKILVGLILLILVACGNEKQVKNPDKNQIQSANQGQIYKEADFETIKNFFYEKLKGQTLIRTYGKDTGQTKIIFENDGHFRGDYFGKIAADGKDYGLTQTAQIYYHAEEIHSSEFEGIFEITKAIDDYRYELDLRDYKITTEEGVYDQIYYHVDFALGLDPESDYILYRPACPIKTLEKDDRLIEIAKKGSPDGEKTAGFIIYNKTCGEVFSQNQ